MRTILRASAGVGGVMFALLAVVIPIGGILSPLNEPGSSRDRFASHWLLFAVRNLELKTKEYFDSAA
jgi:hypothetical protein